MITGQDILLRIGTADGIAASTNHSIECKQNLKQYVAIPGTPDDDGWKHYRPGRLSWSMSTDALFTNDTKWLEQMIADDFRTIATNVRVYERQTSNYVAGKALMSSVMIQAETKNYTRFTAKFTCEDFPTVNVEV